MGNPNTPTGGEDVVQGDVGQEDVAQADVGPDTPRSDVQAGPDVAQADVGQEDIAQAPDVSTPDVPAGPDVATGPDTPTGPDTATIMENVVSDVEATQETDDILLQATIEELRDLQVHIIEVLEREIENGIDNETGENAVAKMSTRASTAIKLLRKLLSDLGTEEEAGSNKSKVVQTRQQAKAILGVLPVIMQEATGVLLAASKIKKWEELEDGGKKEEENEGDEGDEKESPFML